jgi:hypothetical protein
MTFSPSATSPWKRPRLVLALSGLAAGLFLVAASYALWQASSDPGRGFLSGLSGEWLTLGGAGILAGLTLLGFARKAWQKPAWAEGFWGFLFTRPTSSKWIRWISLLFFAVSGSLSCVPAYRFQDAQAYFVRLYPLIVWLAFFSGLNLSLSFLARFELQPDSAQRALHSRKTALFIALGMVIASLALWAAYTWGLTTKYEEYTYAAGVPVLGWQILLAVIAALGFYFIEPKLSRFKHLDLGLVLILWIVTALLWVGEPVPQSYFNPGPYAPNREYHPFSDAALFDIGSQYLLIGEGLNAGAAFERPLYMQVLVFLHLAVGQNYTDVANLQAALFAILAIFVYLIGREISGRPLGIGLAILIALRGVNSIFSASIIDLSSPKQFLTDFPTAVGMALLTWLTVKWLKRPAENRLFVLWAGGLIGLLSLTRTNALLILAPIIILIGIMYRRKLAMAAGLVVIMGAMLIASIYPWGISSDTSILEVYALKIRAVLEIRYHIKFPPPEAMQMGALMSPIRYGSTPAPQPDAAPPGMGFIVQGMYNNLLNSFLILPASFEWNDLRHLLKEASPFWDRTWDKSFPPTETAFLLVQFGILSFGVGMAWKRARLAGLAPLAFFLTYQFSNTLGRTSGGRYLVPVDWVVPVYYLLGLVEIAYLILELFRREIQTAEDVPALPADEFHWPAAASLKIAGIIGLFVLVGLSPTITGAFFQPRYTEQHKAVELESLQAAGYFETAGITSAQLDGFLEQPSAVLMYGRALYPRFYKVNAGEPDNSYPYRTLAYPRLAFELINSNQPIGVILPIEKITSFPNESDTLIVGCINKNLSFVDALVIFLVDEDGQAQVLSRLPASQLQCPAPPVTCNQNNECRSGN